jgi:hypothetical protein
VVLQANGTAIHHQETWQGDEGVKKPI